ncbi:MAG: PDZ domain-containing protein [candidate division KSB1 bacterium]|nr:PDZ domain-containing protein [candidate division KSB1 bacterium]
MNKDIEEAAMIKGGAPFFSWIRIFALCLITNLLGSFPTAAQPNLRYYVEIDEESWNAFHVNITVSNNHAPQLYCALPNEYIGPNIDPAPGCDISKFEVTDRYGGPLPFKSVSCNAWLIATQGNDIINISYQVNGRKDLILGDRLSRNFARIDPSSVFIFVREYLDSPIFLGVRVPHRWKLATGLSATEQAFEYRLINYDQLLRHPLYLAPFDEIYFKIEDRICYILIDGSKTSEINKLSSIATRVAHYQSKLFKEIPFDRYLFIFKVFSAQPGIASAVYENVSISYFSYDHLKNNFDALSLVIAGNFFRNWFGYRLRPQWLHGSILTSSQVSDGSILLYYGLTEYYAGLSLLRAGYWSEMDFINHQIQTMNRYLRSPRKRVMGSMKCLTAGSVAEAEETEVDFWKTTGQLIALLLDLKIREASHNERSLDDVMFFMNHWFGAQKLQYQETDILRAIRAVTGANLSDFFDLYVNSSHELPLVETLQSAGIFIKTARDSVADLGDFQLMSESNLFIQIDASSPLTKAGVKVGDRLISINNRTISSMAQLNRFLETVTIGQELNLAVQRDGAPLILIAKATKRPVLTSVLVSLTPQNELQEKIRKSWLAKQLP